MLELDWLRMMNEVPQIPHIIAARPDHSGVDLKEVFDPATGQVTGRLILGGEKDVDKAVRDAQRAFKGWSALTASKRAAHLYDFRRVIKENAERIAKTISQEHGKTIDDAHGEVVRALEVVEFATGIPTHLGGRFSPRVSSSVDVRSERLPLGVVAGVTPFNFPFMVPLWMIPLAIACGNTFVLKPSEQCPSAANLIAVLADEANIPPGVINVVHGDKRAVDAFLEHEDVKAVSFVGSTRVAEYIYHKGSAGNKRVQALGGAKNHMVVMPDADMDAAADALMGAAYGAAGERCMAISVVVPVGEKTADTLVEKLKGRISNLKVGPCSDLSSEMGPVISDQHKKRVVSLIDSGEEAGADLVVDGRGLSIDGFEEGCWVGATLFDKVKPGMNIYDEEIFGPVLSMVRCASLDEALQVINDNPYANGTSIFTRDGFSARKFSQVVNVGMVGVNIPIPVPVGFHSFGGWKLSNFGSHGIYGSEGVNFYTRLKTVTTRWSENENVGASYSFNSLNS